MKPTITYWTSRIVQAIALIAMFASCSKNEIAGNSLPDGKHPVSLTAAMGGIEKVASRATSSNAWDGGEVVAVQMGGEVKKYTLADAASGMLTAHLDNEPFYWQSTVEQKTLSAWYPHSATQPTTFTVQADQRKEGYQASDLIYVAPTTISYGGNQEILFKHLSSKVVVNVKEGEGVTQADVQRATVTVLNQTLTSGTVAADWSVVKQPLGSTPILPKVLDVSPTGYHKSLEAIVVPQTVAAGARLLQISIGAGNFYYAPPVEQSLDAGEQRTYHITVNKTGITVEVGEVAEWIGTDSEVTSKTLMPGFTATDLKVGDYYYSDGTTSDGGYRKYTDDTTDILPILPVSTDSSNQPPTVVGIVYWLGDNKDPLLAKEQKECTHGLVVALHDAGNQEWSKSVEDITANWLSQQGDTYGITSLKPSTSAQGYANTKALEGYNASEKVRENPRLKVLPIELIATYAASHATPARSSGWYFPSSSELGYMCRGEANEIMSIKGRKILNEQFGKVPGAQLLQLDYYWSSTEKDGSFAWWIHFGNGILNNNSSKATDLFVVRAVLAF